MCRLLFEHTRKSLLKLSVLQTSFPITIIFKFFTGPIGGRYGLIIVQGLLKNANSQTLRLAFLSYHYRFLLPTDLLGGYGMYSLKSCARTQHTALGSTEKPSESSLSLYLIYPRPVIFPSSPHVFVHDLRRHLIISPKVLGLPSRLG